MYSNLQSSFLTKEFSEPCDSPIVKLLCPRDSSSEEFHRDLVKKLQSKHERGPYKSELKKTKK